MDMWNLEELRRMYVGGNINAYKIPKNADFSLKYKNSQKFVEEIDRLVEKSRETEPSDSFMNIEEDNRCSGFSKSVIKKKTMPRFSETPKPAKQVEQTEEKDVKEDIVKPAEQKKVIKKESQNEVSLERKMRNPTNLKKTLDSARSPFSFVPPKPEDADSD